MQVFLRILVYACTISGDIRARHPHVTKMEEYAYRPQLLISAYVKIKAFELTRIINEVFPVVEFESEGGGKYPSITTLNDIDVPDAARQVQEGENDDKVIEAVVQRAKLCGNNMYTFEVLK